MNIDFIKVVPSDVWVEIFRRIPAVDLVPLKAICKAFYRLISDDHFTRVHIKHFTKHPKATKPIIISKYDDHMLIYSKLDTEKRTIDTWYDKARFVDWCSHVWSTVFDSPLPRIQQCRVIDSYHGLILVEIYNRLLLCNPITRSYKFLPFPMYTAPGRINSWKVAYDDVSEHYKVFGLKIWLTRVSLYVFDVHKDGESHHLPPKITTAILGGSQITKASLSVLVDGNVYWLIKIQGETETLTLNGETETLTLNGKTIYKRGIYIVSANVTTEEVKTRSSVTPFIWQDNDNFFAANGTFYFYIEQSYIYPNYDLQLWVLDGVESENPNPSWIMKHRITNHSLISSICRQRFHIRVLGVFRDKMLIMVTQCPGVLHQYDLSREEIEPVTTLTGCNFGWETRSFESFRIVEHVDSLISLRPIKEGRRFEPSML